MYIYIYIYIYVSGVCVCVCVCVDSLVDRSRRIYEYYCQLL